MVLAATPHVCAIPAIVSIPPFEPFFALEDPLGSVNRSCERRRHRLEPFGKGIRDSDHRRELTLMLRRQLQLAGGDAWPQALVFYWNSSGARHLRHRANAARSTSTNPSRAARRRRVRKRLGGV